MAHLPGDPDGYYAALRLLPGASPEEVERAYLALEEKWRESQDFTRFPVQEAHRWLSDPVLKGAYDARCQQGPELRSRTPLVYLLGILTALFLFAALIFPGFLRPEPGTFAPGDVLVHASSGAPLGTVIRREEEHGFPNGMAVDAYLVRPEGGERRWYPAGDLEKHYRILPATTPRTAGPGG